MARTEDLLLEYDSEHVQGKVNDTDENYRVSWSVMTALNAYGRPILCFPTLLLYFCNQALLICSTSRKALVNSL